MTSALRVGVVQMRSGADVWENLLQIDAFVHEAQLQGVQALFFPENALYRGPASQREPAVLGTSEGEDLEAELAERSASWEIDVFLGSVLEASVHPSRPYNSTLLLGRGLRDFAYRKIHLFDFSGSEGVYRESDRVLEGLEPKVAHSCEFRIGLTICFDVRFPELYRRLVFEHKAEILSIPAAFTHETGSAHWHTLLRARAIENLAFVVSAAQWGTHLTEGGERRCYGHALILSPWGEVIAEAPEEGDALLVADLDREILSEVRKKLPALELARLL